MEGATQCGTSEDEAVGFWKGQQWGDGGFMVRDFLPVSVLSSVQAL